MKKRAQLPEVLSGLLLFAVFVACLVATLASGVRVYQSIVGEMDAQYGERTCLSYMTAKLRHADRLNGAYLTQLGDCSALALTETWEDEVYVTYLYYYDGAVRELYTPQGSELLPSDGLAILEVESMEVEQVTPDLFRISCRADGRDAETFVSLRAAEGGRGQ